MSILNPFDGIKAAFFDIDGVLSIPRYFKDGEFKPGGGNKWWESFSSIHPEDAYDDCKVAPVIKNFVKKLHDTGIDTQFLSTESISSAQTAKERFVSREYKNIINGGTFVQSDNLKLDFLNKYALSKHINPSDIYFLDDTFSIVTEISEAGFNAHHISEFLVSPIGL